MEVTSDFAFVTLVGVVHLEIVFTCSPFPSNESAVSDLKKSPTKLKSKQFCHSDRWSFIFVRIRKNVSLQLISISGSFQ